MRFILYSKIQTLISMIKCNLDFNISDNELISISLLTSRIIDKEITHYINEKKFANNIKLNSMEKKALRKEIIYNHILNNDKTLISNENIENALQIILNGIKRDKNKVIGTIKAQLTCHTNANINKYLNIIINNETNYNHLLIFNVDNTISPDILAYNIVNEYNFLVNYGYIAIIFNQINWENIADIALFCENIFIEYNFSVFNKNKQSKINELKSFLYQNQNISYQNHLNDIIEKFYSGVSYGFHFNDLFISSDGQKAILIMQKIELDENVIYCPDCMNNIVRGNSYTKLLQKSFECQNPNCPSRSKIGRGKRFDYFSVKRNTYLHLNNPNDIVDIDLIKQYRKDIFENSNNILDMLVSFYSFHNNNIKIISDFEYALFTKHRNIYSANFIKKSYNYKNYPLFHLMQNIIKNISIHPQKEHYLMHITNQYSIYRGNSSNLLYNIKEKITSAITSPPYYNAREYSQWPSLICYLVDMSISAKAVYDNIENQGMYFYNIGDIVGLDNIFVSSTMSKKRLLLGFLSIMIFKMIGWKFHNNIIWYKGEVQSKRNSMENLFPTYIKPINCYEHILVFSKNNNTINIPNLVTYIEPVKKINSKGENIFGHTAPYPIALVELLLPYMNKNGYILDPFLGSGTTILASLKHNYKAVGIELNEEYFLLATSKITQKLNSLSIENFI